MSLESIRQGIGAGSRSFFQQRSLRPRWFLPCFLVCTLSACAVHKQADYMEAIGAPLRDFNLIYVPVPDALEQAKLHPYAIPADWSCTGLNAEITALDEVLGPDGDMPSTEKTLWQKGKDEANSQAVGAIRHTTEGFIPFLGWVRRLSGAERHSKQVTEAIGAGSMRRAFLKGLRVSRACPLVTPQAAYGQPLFLLPDQD